VLAKLLQPHVEAALAYVSKVALGKREEVPSPRQSDKAKRTARPSREHNRGERTFSSQPELGPFDAYVLDGDRYIRVEGKDSYALVDTKTGNVTWIGKMRKNGGSNPSGNAASAYAKPGVTR
jgi:hypothetical protein